MLSARETRTPFRRSRLENSTSFSSMGVEALVQDVLVALGTRGLHLRPLQLDVVLQLLLRLPDVALVLEDGGERLRDQLLVERGDVQDGERLRPVERLADARRFLEVQLPDAVHDG